MNEKVTVTRTAEGSRTQEASKPIDRSDAGDLSKFPIRTVPNEARCFFTTETHELSLSPCCPVSHNPRPGSILTITYDPVDKILEVASLRKYVDSYCGGRGAVRSMEGMIQEIAQSCANCSGVCIIVFADLVIDPDQKMKLKCVAFPDE